VSENVYAPPLAQSAPAPEQPHDFFIVSPMKFMILATLTFGLYIYYWSYKNWSLYQRTTQVDIWPWARGLLCIFYIHQLYRLADKKIRGDGRSFDWDFEQWATVYVVLNVAAMVLNTVMKCVNGYEYLGGWLLLLMPLRAFVVSQSQSMINFAANDPQGLSNSRFTAWNYLFMVLGALLWGIALLGVWALYH
jgi:hypothetical protein